MARKAQDNPALDMTPMIDVVFELIIFFVVTLKMSEEKDKTIELEDGAHGVMLTPEEMPPTQMTIDIAKNGRISMGDVTKTPAQIQAAVADRKRRFGEFPVLIRADFEVKHEHVAKVMNACTAAGVWKLAFVAVGEDKTKGSLRPRLMKRRARMR